MQLEDIDHEMNEENKAAFDSIVNALSWSEEDGLQVQVILYAMLFLKKNPNVSIPDAIDYGIGEWLK